jgi:hypothetical protein
MGSWGVYGANFQHTSLAGRGKRLINPDDHPRHGRKAGVRALGTIVHALGREADDLKVPEAACFSVPEAHAVVSPMDVQPAIEDHVLAAGLFPAGAAAVDELKLESRQSVLQDVTADHLIAGSRENQTVFVGNDESR